jgi:hypothetical protein
MGEHEMSVLMGHEKAARILGQALKDEGENSAMTPTESRLLHMMGDAHIAAADSMEQAMRAEAIPSGPQLHIHVDDAVLVKPVSP